jgi:hypothetical protein
VSDSNVQRLLVLSTLHIPGQSVINDGWIWGDYGCGCWCYAYDDDVFAEMGVPWLAPICAYARRHGCDWIRFDADWNVIAELPTFDELWT